jgi:hypothetical protein
VRLSGVLQDVQERVKPWLTPGLLGVIDRTFGRLDDVVAGFSVARARDVAWVHAKTLWSIREHRQLSFAYLLTLDRMVGFAGRELLAPTLLGLARWSSAQEWLPGRARWLPRRTAGRSVGLGQVGERPAHDRSAERDWNVNQRPFGPSPNGSVRPDRGTSASRP